MSKHAAPNLIVPEALSPAPDEVMLSALLRLHLNLAPLLGALLTVLISLVVFLQLPFLLSAV